MAAETSAPAPARHRPRSTTVFVAAFVAGAAAAVGVNRALDVHLSQAKPQVECEPIFVALRSLPQGVPVTVWDVALRDWPKAMLPSTALRVTDSFEGCLLRVPLREGQPLLSAQLVKPEAIAPAASEPAAAEGDEPIVEEAFVPPTPAAPPVAQAEPAAAPVEAAAEPRTTEQPAGMAAAEPALTDMQAAAEPTAVAPADDEMPPAVTGEPTLAGPATAPLGEPSGLAVQQPETPGQPLESLRADLAAGPSRTDEQPTSIDAAFDVADMPSRPPADLSKIPSVMSAIDATVPPSAEETRTAAGVRYLVVPERIARQADTSFTTPVAPEGRPTGDREQATATPRAAATPATGPSAAPKPAAQPQTTAGRPQGQPGQAQRRQATTRQPQSGSQQTRRQGQPTPPRGPQPPPNDAGRGESNPRAWGGMFPNVSAGLEAMGGWRVREAAVPQAKPARP